MLFVRAKKGRRGNFLLYAKAKLLTTKDTKVHKGNLEMQILRDTSSSLVVHGFLRAVAKLITTLNA